MTCSIDFRQSLFVVIPVIVQWAHEQSSHGGNNGGYGRAQHHGLSLNKAPWLEPLLSAQSTNIMTNTDPPNMAPFPRVVSELLDRSLITLDHFHHRSGSTLLLLE